jgi:hypothetical protein
MTALTRIAATVHSAGVIPPVSPDSTGLPGGAAIHTLMAWAMALALFACVIGGIGAGAAIGIGNMTHRAHLIERGKAGLICAVLGAVVAGSAVTLVNTGFGMAK